MIRVLISGINGKMGREVQRAVAAAEDLVCVAGVDPQEGQSDECPGYGALSEALARETVDVVIDFTNPAVVEQNIQCCLDHNTPVVVGTTGLTEEALCRLSDQARQQQCGVVVAPNFAIGAILMMKFAQEAAKFFPEAEIIEYHHQQKADAPSGTALKTAKMMSEARLVAPDGVQVGRADHADARGYVVNDIPIHSVRLPGYVAHQEVLLSLPGQTLTIRHDSTERISFMPGVLLAVRKAPKLKGLIFGLEHLLF